MKTYEIQTRRENEISDFGVHGNTPIGIQCKGYVAKTNYSVAEAPNTSGASQRSGPTGPFVQAKLEINQQGDRFEQEADAMADSVMRMSQSHSMRQPLSFSAVTTLQRKCAHCEEKEKRQLQRTEKNNGEPATETRIETYLRGLSGGQPLSHESKSFFEPRMGYDFSSVRVHHDAAAVKSAQSLNAHAYTLGNNIVFNSGQYLPDSEAGKRLLGHELTHVIQQGEGKAGPGSRIIQRQARNSCMVLHPENCVNYEEWISLFSALPTSLSNDTAPGYTIDGFRFLGDRRADRNALSGQPGAPPVPRRSRRDRVTDHFIDHPTQLWVSNNLPYELQISAYQLPSNCADMAVILRHVWLFYQNRSEIFRNWRIGVGIPNESELERQVRIGHVISGVESFNVSAMVNAYSDVDGNPIRSYRRLAPMLHPGDILVWEHQWRQPLPNHLCNSRRGNIFRIGSTPEVNSCYSVRRWTGHTQTIMSIDDNGTIHALQGNEPISRGHFEPGRRLGGGAYEHGRRVEGGADQIRRYQRAHHQAVSSESDLGNAPGRRIETSLLSGRKLGDIYIDGRPVWTWDDRDHTVLIAAGPPAAAHGGPSMDDWSPAGRAPAGRSAIRRVQVLGELSHWIVRIAAATQEELTGCLESAMQSARAEIERTASGRVSLGVADAIRLGQSAGNWFASRVQISGVGLSLLFEQMNRMLRIIDSFRPNVRSARHDDVSSFFATVRDQFIQVCSTVFQSSFETQLRQILSQNTNPSIESDARTLGVTFGSGASNFAQSAGEVRGDSQMDLMLNLRETIERVRSDRNTSQNDRIFGIINSSFNTAAALERLSGSLENAMYSNRATVERLTSASSDSISDSVANTFGYDAADRFATLAQMEGADLNVLFDRMTRMLRRIVSFRETGQSPREINVTRYFANVGDGFIQECSYVFQTAFEFQLRRIRSQISSPQIANDASALGDTFGARVWNFARAAEDFARLSHLDLIVNLRQTIQRVKGEGNANQVQIDRIFGIVDSNFDRAARGASQAAIDFSRAQPGQGVTVIRTLLTGFDAFNLLNASDPPRPREWNPSGAAVLALDGTTVDAGTNLTASVEGVIFPVSFPVFGTGLVESVLSTHIRNHAVDSIITVSEDPNIDVHHGVRLEQFAVGVRNNGLEPIPEAERGNLGAAIIQTLDNVTLSGISNNTGQSGILRPTIGTEIELRFLNSQAALRARHALRLQRSIDIERSQHASEIQLLRRLGRTQDEVDSIVWIEDYTAINLIISSMESMPNSGRHGTEIEFRADGQNFRATLIEGPGGSFLSNEISYRTLRLLDSQRRGTDREAISYHIHTQHGGVVIPDRSTANSINYEQSRVEATNTRSQLINTLRRIVGATARYVHRRRSTHRRQ